MRYFIGFLVSIGLIVLVVFLVLRGIGGGGTAKSTTPLSDYAGTDSVVQMLVDGPIIADENHRAYRITVGRTLVTVESLKGYQYQLIETKAYTNNQIAYTNFLRALDISGFSKGNKESKQTDPKGVCATGSRMSFKILSGASEVQNYWGTSCGSQGNFKGNIPQVRSLFIKQIPGADQRIVTRLGL